QSAQRSQKSFSLAIDRAAGRFLLAVRLKRSPYTDPQDARLARGEKDVCALCGLRGCMPGGERDTGILTAGATTTQPQCNQSERDLCALCVLRGCFPPGPA